MLAIDIGNTNITAGVFEGGELLDVFRLPTQECIDSSSFFPMLPGLGKELVRDAVMVSVRRDAAAVVVREVSKLAGHAPMVVDIDTPMGIRIAYETRDTLGMDRLVCASAAFYLYGQKNNPVIAIDMGTATTIDYVSAEGVFTGGMIAPGIMTAYEGLLSAAPQLPRIDDLYVAEPVGASTREGVRSGVVMGHAFMIQKAVETFSRRSRSKPVVVLTGGPSVIVAEGLPKTYIIDGNLILKGLCMLRSWARVKKD